MKVSGHTLATAVVSTILLAALVGIYWRLKTAEEESGNASSATEIGALSSTRAPDVVMPVNGAHVLRDTFIIYVDAAGEAEAARGAALPAEIAGPVVEVRVQEGDAVRAGQVLVRIEPTPYELTVKQAEAALSKAQAKFTELTLFHEEIADPAVRADRERMARVLSGLVDAEVALERARLDLERATIRAPFRGHVANLAVVPGQRVATGDSICAVVDLSRIRVEVQALEGDVVHLGLGREARVVLSALPDTVLWGVVTALNPVIDRRTRAARVAVALENPDGRIRPGMYAHVRIAARLYPDRLMVPREAILERERRRLVFVFEPDSSGTDVGLAKWTYVTTGLENEKFAEIVPSNEAAQLRPGQIVLVDGHSTLIHDAKVRLVRE